jgi:PAS domain S-box-containing protein
LARLITNHDWSETALGPIDQWSGSLRATVNLIVHSPVPMVMLLGELGHLIYNDAYSVFAGDRHPKQLGLPVLDAWPEVAGFNANVMKVGLAGGTLHYRDQELTLYRKGGEPEQVFMNLDYSPVFDDAGHPAGVIAIVIDTTERVVAERRIAAEHQRLTQLFEQAPTFKAMLTLPDYRIMLANPEYHRLIGGRDVVGRTVAEALPEAVEQGFVGLLDQVRATKQTHRADRTLYSISATERAPAREVFVDFMYQPILDSNGEVSGIFVEGLDVTDRVKTNLALRESEARFRNMADHAPVLMWVTDASGACTYLNRAWYEFTGQQEDAALGLGWLDATHPDDCERAEAIFMKANADRAPFRIEYRLRTADGGYRWAIDAASPRFGEDGSFFGYIGSVIDIDDRRRAEQAVLAANAQLAETNERLDSEVQAAVAARETALAQLYEARKFETLGQLSSGIAHDFNNLLTPVMAALDLVRTKLPPQDAVLPLVTGALQSSERAKTIVQRLLAFGRRQTLDLRSIDASQVVLSMRASIEQSVGHGIAVTIDIAKALPHVMIDPAQLELALINLTQNASEAMPGGGTIAIALERGENLSAGGAPTVALRVRDTGMGMPAGILARATEPFFTTKDNSQSSGLGLSMVEGLASQAGGRLELTSVPGKGSTATLYLVAAGSDDVPAVAQPSVEATGNKPEPARILLVDDEVLIRMALAMWLSDEGHNVVEAGSGDAALALIEGGETPDLIITDHRMPGMTGAALAGKVRAHRPDLPILMVTGFADLSEDERRGIEVIGKPVNFDELGSRLSRLLAGRKTTALAERA